MEEAIGGVRARGVRLSVPRRRVLEALFAADGSVSAVHLARALARQAPEAVRVAKRSIGRAFEDPLHAALLDALDLSKEPDRLRARYGIGKWSYNKYDGYDWDSRPLILARRLVEAGVRAVTLSLATWDHHGGGQGGSEPGQLGYVSDVVEDAEGYYYVAEFGENHRITKLESDGKFVKCSWSEGSAPR